MIDSYQFGHIIIDGKRYTSDVIIYPDKIDDHWWRKEGHLLLPEDLKEVVKQNPEVLVIGTGDPGLMRISATTQEWVQSRGIEIRVKPTRSACQIYNQLCKTKKTIAALHLTC